jgi:hypothetical protein
MAIHSFARWAGNRFPQRNSRRRSDPFLRKLTIEPLEDRRLLSVADDLLSSDLYENTICTVTDSAETSTASAESTEESADNRWIVRFSDDLDAEGRAALVASQNAVVVTDLPLINGAVVERQAYATSSALAEATWSAMSGVVYAEADSVVQIASTTPNDPLFSSLWGMNNTGQSGGTADVDIDAPEAWNLCTGSSTVVVADIDTGVDYTHPDLAANMWVNPGETAGDGIDNDANGYVDDIYGIDACNVDSNPMDDHGHGTHTAGTIGAVGNNGIGVAGVNWNVKIMALKFLNAEGKGSTSDAVICLQYLTMMKTTYGVNVVVSSNSWGGSDGSQALYDAIKASNDAGVMFVAAAGNDGMNTDTTPSYPASYNLPGIISVAAIDANAHCASFSNYGLTSVDVAAPGVDVLSTVKGGGYATMSGTSMATPHVAGVVALTAAYCGSVPLAEVKAAILAAADPISSLDGLCVSGGCVNAHRTLEQLGLTISSSVPASNAIVASKPVDFTLNFSHPYDPTTVGAADLTVNGIPAASVTQTNSTTLVFHYTTSPVTGEGPQTMAVAAGALKRLSDGDPIGDWSAKFYYDTLRLAVAATNPAGGESVALPWTSLELDFNEVIDPTSVKATDLSVSQGSVSSVTVVDSDTVRFTLAGIIDEGFVTFTLLAGSVLDQYGTPGLAYTAGVAVDCVIEALAAFKPVSPSGSLVYEQSASRDITLAGDTDSFTFALDAGQTLSVMAAPTEVGLQPTVSLVSPGSAVLGQATAAAAGKNAILQTMTISEAGTYTLVVGGAAQTTGPYQAKVILNVRIEAEESGVSTNDTIATAEDLSNSFLELTTTTERSAVAGSLSLPQEPVVSATGAIYAEYTDLSSVMDGSHVERGSTLTRGMVYWRNLTTSVQIDLGVSVPIQGVSVQADGDDLYRLEYWNSSTAAWCVLWNIPNYASVGSGMVCRPDYGYTETERFHTLASVVTTSKLRFSAVSTTGSTPYFALSELELQLAPDIYQVPLSAGESLSLAVETANWTYCTLELLNASGTVVATGTETTNARQTIDTYVATTAGTYYARVSGLGDYTLLAVRGASFETEPNGASPVVGPSAAGSFSVLGEVSAAAGERLSRPTDRGLETYLLDSNWGNWMAGGVGDRLWMNQFTAVSGADCIDSIAVCFGYLPTGRKAYVLLYDDPNDDGDPHDAVLLNITETTVADAATGSYFTVPIAPTRVSGSFFVAALVRDFDYGEMPMLFEYNTTPLNRSWYISGAANQLDIENLNTNSPKTGKMYALGANAAIRANASAYGDSDTILLAAAAGEVLRITSATPGDAWSSTTRNALDPQLELLDPSGAIVAYDDNSAPDGKNATLCYTALTSGIYVLRVSGVGGSQGAYLLDVVHTAASSKISGQVFRDLDADGVQDGGEPVLAGRTVCLDLGGNGSVDRSVTTDAKGCYLFTDVPAGTHTLSQVLPSGWVATSSSYNVSVGTGQSLAGYDFGCRPDNHAPRLDPGGFMYGLTIVEGDTNNEGKLLSTLIAGAGGDRITDPDSGAVEGIAVVAVNNLNGAWQYQSSGGAWTDFGSPTMACARLLACNETTRVRFVPNAGWVGTVEQGILFRAWDRTSGTVGETADTTIHGGSTAFSEAIEWVMQSVYAAIYGQVFDDANGDGVRSDGEVGRAGWTIQLDLSNDGTIDQTATSDSDGNYVFSLVKTSGTHRVVEVAQSGWVQTCPTDSSGYTFSYFVFTKTKPMDFGNLMVAHAPVLDNSGLMTLAPIHEDESGNTGTLVSAIIASAGGDPITDSDSDAVEGIAVIGVDNTHGAWQYKIGASGEWIGFGTLSEAGARLLASDDATWIRFVPAANWNGSLDPGITFRAWDQASGTAGGTADTTTSGGATAFSRASETASIQVMAVNDAPAGGDSALTMREDATWTFTAADFGFTDPNDRPANAFYGVKTTTLPTAGTLKLNGTAILAGDWVSLAQIALGQLTFEPAANAFGLAYATFTFQVQDDGGTDDGGVDLDPTPNTFTLHVTAVNDPPVVAAIAGSPDWLLAGEPLTLTATGVADPLDPGGSAVRVDFYRESNGTIGLQTGTGGDTLVGTDGIAADGWSADVLTTGLTPGAYTYYAQAVDDEGATSGVGTEAAATENAVVEVSNGSLDVDGNGSADALTDGILILRYLFDRAGAWNYSDALGAGATWTTRLQLRAAMDDISSKVLDVDGNGTADALTDGILILRYLFDPAGAWNYSDALGSGATRTTRDALRAYLDLYGLATTETSLLAAAGSTATCEGTDVQAASGPCDPIQTIVDASNPSTTETSVQPAADSAAVCDSPAAAAEIAADAQACDAILHAWSEPNVLDARLARVAGWIRAQANRDDAWTTDYLFGQDDLDEMLTVWPGRRVPPAGS